MRANRQKFVFGKMPVCNCKPERAPHIGDFCFPLCWRCSGAVVGVLLSYFIRVAGLIANLTDRQTVFWAIAFMLPAAIHFWLPKFGIKTRNSMRFCTGIMLGIGVERIWHLILMML